MVIFSNEKAPVLFEMQNRGFFYFRRELETKNKSVITRLWLVSKVGRYLGYTKSNLKFTRKKEIIIEREKIFELLEIEIDRNQKKYPKPIIGEAESSEVKALAHYLWLTDMLAILICEVGEVGEALQGEKDLPESLIKVSSMCCRWLETLK
jgi:hypothetical protein